ncbi:hypothetical protein Q4Q34_16035 [Flavivirga abyssicola]|uniref:hypothetical protein n=1 Tax=Flavivirga abyssicola TaxID=3063533 RepID=UPI0026E00BA6|nr:hypothetical protein [Flavivirga sp. MEBiC07777]WVK12727.1 hypothetical protein Q4Q34_16035 [Flavivirga sp. MEBiC07777]
MKTLKRKYLNGEKTDLIPQENMDLIRKELRDNFTFIYHEDLDSIYYRKRGDFTTKPVDLDFVTTLTKNYICSDIYCNKNFIIYTIEYLSISRDSWPYLRELPLWDTNRESEMKKLLLAIKTTDQWFFKKYFEAYLLAEVEYTLGKRNFLVGRIFYYPKEIKLEVREWIYSLRPWQRISHQKTIFNYSTNYTEDEGNEITFDVEEVDNNIVVDMDLVWAELLYRVINGEKSCLDSFEEDLYINKFLRRPNNK